MVVAGKTLFLSHGLNPWARASSPTCVSHLLRWMGPLGIHRNHPSHPWLVIGQLLIAMAAVLKPQQRDFAEVPRSTLHWILLSATNSGQYCASCPSSVGMRLATLRSFLRMVVNGLVRMAVAANGWCRSGGNTSRKAFSASASQVQAVSLRTIPWARIPLKNFNLNVGFAICGAVRQDEHR